VSLDEQGEPKAVAPLLIETPEDRERQRQAQARRSERLARKTKGAATESPRP